MKLKHKRMDMKIPNHEEVMLMNKEEANALMILCIGRVFRMLDRPNKKNDLDMFEKCSMIAKSCAERIELLDYYEINMKSFSKEIPYNHSISMYI